MKFTLSISILVLLITSTGCKETPSGPVTNMYIYSMDSLNSPFIMPQVVFTNPANGAVGPFDHYGLNTPSNPKITIQFNKLIDVRDLETGTIRLSANGTTTNLMLSDYYYTSGNANPFLRNILIFNVTREYRANQTYTVTVDSSLRDVHGNRLAHTFSFSFTPEPQFRVYDGYPSSYYYTDGVPPTYFSPIIIDLNSKVTTNFFGKLLISPPIRGNWTFNPDSYGNNGDSTVVYFISRDTLDYDAQYTVSVAGSAADENGLGIAAPYQFSFTTQPFQVSSNGWSSYIGPGGFTVFYSMGFSFNGFVDTSTVRSSITFSPNLSFTLSFSSSGGGYNYVYVYPNVQLMQPNTTYKVTLSTGIRSLRGAYLKYPYSYSVTTGSL